MSNNSYLQALRQKVGKGLLLVPGVAAVIHDECNRLLLQEKGSGGGWSLPAGAIEPGETPQEAVICEVREETCLRIEVVAIRGVFGGSKFGYIYPNGDFVENVVTLFACKAAGVHSGLFDEETKSLRYFSRSEMPDLALPYPLDILFDPIF